MHPLENHKMLMNVNPTAHLITHYINGLYSSICCFYLFCVTKVNTSKQTSCIPAILDLLSLLWWFLSLFLSKQYEPLICLHCKDLQSMISHCNSDNCDNLWHCRQAKKITRAVKKSWWSFWVWSSTLAYVINVSTTVNMSRFYKKKNCMIQSLLNNHCREKSSPPLCWF